MLTKKIKLALATCAALAGAVGIAAASPADGSAPTQQDVSAWKAKRAEKKAEMLAKYDTNKDGKLDEQERAVMRNEKATERFQKMDTNKDGVISLDEFKAEQGKFHARHGFRHHRGGLRGQGAAPGGDTK